MLRPHGYHTWTAPDGRVLMERDSVNCAHCQRVLLTQPGARGSDDLPGWCGRCHAVICGSCAVMGRCEPFEERIAQMERRAELLRTLGL